MSHILFALLPPKSSRYIIPQTIISLQPAIRPYLFHRPFASPSSRTSSLDNSNFTANHRQPHISFRRSFVPPPSRRIIPLTAATSLLASDNRNNRRPLRPKSGKRNRSETFFTVHYLLTENAAKRSPQPSPANTIHHAQHMPGTRHFIRARIGIPPKRPNAAPYPTHNGRQTHKKPERKILSGFCLRVMLSRIILQARAVR